MMSAVAFYVLANFITPMFVHQIHTLHIVCCMCTAYADTLIHNSYLSPNIFQCKLETTETDDRMRYCCCYCCCYKIKRPNATLNVQYGMCTMQWMLSQICRFYLIQIKLVNRHKFSSFVDICCWMYFICMLFDSSVICNFSPRRETFSFISVRLFTVY